MLILFCKAVVYQVDPDRALRRDAEASGVEARPRHFTSPLPRPSRTPSQAVTKDAFELLRFIAGKRLALGRRMVIDATNVEPKTRGPEPMR
jgi:predicted kinase